MKKLVFCLPAVIFTIAVIALSVLLRTFSPMWCIWAVLLWVSGILLVKGKFWGSLFGLIPAIHIIYMSTRYTGQVIDIELPLGILMAAYVLGCGFWVWRKGLDK